MNLLVKERTPQFVGNQCTCVFVFACLSAEKLFRLCGRVHVNAHIISVYRYVWLLSVLGVGGSELL